MEQLNAAGNMIHINLVGSISHQCEPILHERIILSDFHGGDQKIGI